MADANNLTTAFDNAPGPVQKAACSVGKRRFSEVQDVQPDLARLKLLRPQMLVVADNVYGRQDGTGPAYFAETFSDPDHQSDFVNANGNRLKPTVFNFFPEDTCFRLHLDGQKWEKAQINAEKEEVEEEITTLNAQLATRTTQRDTALTQVETLNGQLATRTTERDNALAQVTTLNGQLATRTTERDTARTQVTTLNGQLAERTSELEARTKERDDARNRLEAAELDLKEGTRELRNLQDELDGVIRERDSFQKQTKELTEKVVTLEARKVSPPLDRYPGDRATQRDGGVNGEEEATP